MRNRYVVFAAAVIAVSPGVVGYAAEGDFNRINPDFLVTAEEAYAWHAFKDEGGPTFSGSPSWHRYLKFVENELKACGAVDVIRHPFSYDRWYTSEWPDDANWTLVSGGDSVRVASYGAYSGSTEKGGLTAELVYYDNTDPPEDIEGKIVVFKTRAEAMASVLGDYEYHHAADDGSAAGRDPDASQTTSALVFSQLVQTSGFIRTMTAGGAAGGLIVFDMAYDQLAGMYAFPVPPRYDVPTLYLDRNAGAQVVADAKQGRTATITLLAKRERVETYQLIAFLPGRHYGTPQDEKILLATHSDGPSISQDNGPMGFLGVARYFSHIAQSERQRTIMFFVDNRHYMPGMERTFEKQSWFANRADAYDGIVAVMGIEHLGQIEYREIGDVFEPSGSVDPSRLYCTNNQRMVDMAIGAVKANGFYGASVTNVDRPGIEGESQGRWFGLGSIARRLGLPGYATMGSMGAYWSTNGRIDKFDKDHFVRQVATMSQLLGQLMVADLNTVATVSE